MRGQGTVLDQKPAALVLGRSAQKLIISIAIATGPLRSSAAGRRAATQGGGLGRAGCGAHRHALRRWLLLLLLLLLLLALVLVHGRQRARDDVRRLRVCRGLTTLEQGGNSATARRKHIMSEA